MVHAGPSLLLLPLKLVSIIKRRIRLTFLNKNLLIALQPNLDMKVKDVMVVGWMMLLITLLTMVLPQKKNIHTKELIKPVNLHKKRNTILIHLLMLSH